MAQEGRDAPDKIVGTPFPASTGYLLARAGAEARRLFTRLLGEHGLSPHHLGVLLALSHHGRCRQQSVSEMIGVDPRNTTPLVDALLQRGLLARSPDPVDRRRHVLELTDDGRVLLEELHRSSHALEDQLLAGLDAQQRTQLHALLLTLLGTAFTAAT